MCVSDGFLFFIFEENSDGFFKV